MEIRPDRFKAVAAKTLGKIYGYVTVLWDKVPLENSFRLPFDVIKRKFIFGNGSRRLEGIYCC